MKKKEVVIINFWGLGDLVSSLYFINKNLDNNFFLISPHKRIIVESLINCINIQTNVNVSSNEKKIFLIFEILIQIFLKKKIIFTAPLAGKSRKFAKFLSFFYKDLILADEKGNIYNNNNKIII